MSPWVRLALTADLPAVDEAKEFFCGDKTICVANLNGSCSAMDNVCLHRGGPLGEGMVEQGKVVCPWHGWSWDARTGVAEQNRNMKIAVYPLKVVGGDVMIEI